MLLCRVWLTVHVITTQPWTTNDGILQSIPSRFMLFCVNFFIDGIGGKNYQDKTKSGFAVWKQADFFHLRCGTCGCPNVEVCRLTGNSSGPPHFVIQPSPYILAHTLFPPQKKLHLRPQIECIITRLVGCNTLWMTCAENSSHPSQETFR